MTIPAPDFPARVRAELARLGLSYDAAAAKLGVTRTAVRQFSNPRLSTLFRLTDELGMDPRALVPEWFGPKRRKAR